MAELRDPAIKLFGRTIAAVPPPPMPTPAAAAAAASDQVEPPEESPEVEKILAAGDKQSGQRQVLLSGAIAAYVFLSLAAEAKKGFNAVSDKKDGYSFLYPFGWQEVVIRGQDKVFKDVIEPLESVSVNIVATTKQDIRDLGNPQEVAESLIKKVLAPPSQKTKLIEASEVAGHFTYGVMALSAATFMFWNLFGSQLVPAAIQRGSSINERNCNLGGSRQDPESSGTCYTSASSNPSSDT
uniref:PsbP C-terminal domain-containing protein n=1 Tax=Ananas comosus var. bracteatus TaxID=296719 RepID=A0A6V7Q1V3_ANACO|nr:unnamed protein product [Ananas comosus var. bracteatus]